MIDHLTKKTDITRKIFTKTDRITDFEKNIYNLQTDTDVFRNNQNYS